MSATPGMNRKLIIRAVILLTMLVTTVVLTPAHSRDSESLSGYNAGLLASEAGDYASAAMQWEPLAKEGNAIAQFNLALMYHGGLGVEHDENAAVVLYQKSAANGYPKAQEFLAVAYREGWFGLPKDNKKANYWENKLDSNLR